MDIQHMDKLTQRRQAEFLAWREYLNTWPWQWFIKLTLKDYDCHAKAVDMLIKWTRKLCTEEHIQVGFAYIYCENYGLGHMHVLMIGSNANGDKTLADVSRSKWNRHWSCISNIQIPDSNIKVSKYLALHLFRFKCSNYPVIDFYNIKLLRRYKRNSE